MDQRVLAQFEQGFNAGNKHELAKGGDAKRERGQDHHYEQINHRQSKSEPAPRPEVEAARPERLARDGGVAAAGEHFLLQPDEHCGDRHEDDRDCRRGVVKRRAPCRELEDVGGEHGEVGLVGEHRRHAVDPQHHHERQQHARNDGRCDQRERHAEERRECACTRNLGGLFQARIHVAQSRGREHVHIRRVVDAEYEDQPGHRVKVDVQIHAE